jgi:hypothetical protein
MTQLVLDLKYRWLDRAVIIFSRLISIWLSASTWPDLIWSDLTWSDLIRRPNAHRCLTLIVEDRMLNKVLWCENSRLQNKCCFFSSCYDSIVWHRTVLYLLYTGARKAYYYNTEEDLHCRQRRYEWFSCSSWLRCSRNPTHYASVDVMRTDANDFGGESCICS